VVFSSPRKRKQKIGVHIGLGKAALVKLIALPFLKIKKPALKPATTDQLTNLNPQKKQLF